MPKSAVTQFSEASHLVTDMKMDGDYMVAEIEVIDTPHGKTLKSIMEKPDTFALRTAGIGNGQVNDAGVLVINDSYKLISVNVVPLTEAATIG